jgi:hypothetical protein
VGSARDAVLFTRILGFSLAVPALLRLGPARLSARLERTIRGRAHIRAEPETLATLVDLAMRAGAPAVRRGCLTRGITLYYFLRRAGEPVTLEFGIGDVGGDPVGHCWLSRGGEPFLEARDPRPVFSTVYSFPA